jgi:hypothetical protein
MLGQMLREQSGNGVVAAPGREWNDETYGPRRIGFCSLSWCGRYSGKGRYHSQQRVEISHPGLRFSFSLSLQPSLALPAPSLPQPLLFAAISICVAVFSRQ